MENKETIKIDGVEYIKKDLMNNYTSEDGLEYVIIRTYSAGVHAGFLKSREGKEVVLVKARRLWYWDGAFTLSAIAMNGVTKPENCKFSVEVDEILLTEAIEVIKVTDKAKKIIRGVKNHEG